MLSIPHLIIIFVVVLVVFGPEKLPDLARNLGKVMAEFRKATSDLRMNFEDHMRDIEREADQRRTGGTVPPAAGAPGTVATAAPSLSSPETSVSGTAASTEPAATLDLFEQSPPQEPHEPTSKPETVSDGGTRPA